MAVARAPTSWRGKTFRRSDHPSRGHSIETFLKNGSICSRSGFNEQARWPAHCRRKIKLACLHGAKALGLFRLTRRLTARSVRILCYHGIWLGQDAGFAGDSMFMSAGTFEARLRMLKSLGYRVVSLESAVEGLTRGDPPRDGVVITIDDGWYGTFRHMLPALNQHAMPATLYCDTAHLLRNSPIPHVMARYLVGLHADRWRGNMAPMLERATDLTLSHEERLRAALDLAKALGCDGEAYVARRVFSYMTPEELKTASEAGLDVQLHTHNHSLGDMSPARIRSEIEQNLDALTRLLGQSPNSFRHFCYPSGRFTSAAAKALEREGLASSTTIRPGLSSVTSPRHMLPRFVDGENVSALEFEAELCGFMTAVRWVSQGLRRPAAHQQATA